jgi:Icc-related predicted phosphoesterase
MRILCISDTHGLHKALGDLPEADVIVHAGDFCNRGSMEESLRALGWFNALPYKHRVVIAGNHDIFMDPGHLDYPSSESAIKAMLPVSEGFHYLNDSGATIEGVKFWGSPVQPEFFGWAFNRRRGDAIQKHWDLIPKDIQVLVTHGPAYGFVDECPNYKMPWVNEKVGCNNLLQTIQKLPNLKAHVCGHIHAAYGYAYSPEDVLHINASICNEQYVPINKPIAFDLTEHIAQVYTYV